MVIIFDIGAILLVLAVIGIVLLLGTEMGIDGICKYFIANPQQVVLICTLIFIVISVIIYFMFLKPEKKAKKRNGFFYILTLTLSLSASTIINMYNTVYAIQNWHRTDTIMRLFLFPVTLFMIVMLIIVYIISYCVGSAPFLFYLLKHSDQIDYPDMAFKIFNIIWSFVFYAVIIILLLSGNTSIFMLVT